MKITLSTIVSVLLSDSVIGNPLKSKGNKWESKAKKQVKTGKKGLKTCDAAKKQTQNCGKFRFNTPTYDSGTNLDLCYPLTVDQFPMSMTNAESMRTFADYRVSNLLNHLCYDDITKQIFEFYDNMKLTHADSETTEDRDIYWNELRELIAIYYLRENGWKSSQIFDQVALVSSKPVNFVFNPIDSIDESAQHVYSDFPPTHNTDFVLGDSSDPESAALVEGKELLDFDFLTMMDENIFQVDECFSPYQDEFINSKIAMGRTLGWAIDTVSTGIFAAKWAGGRARPQEIIWEIHENGSANFDVPQDIVNAVQNMNLNNEFDFTAFKTTGAPQHPSHPAMHSASSSVSTWLQIIANLTPEQIALAKHFDFSVSYFRSFAGVHYPSDNRAGLQLGCFIIEMAAPAYLAERYGCSAKTMAQIKSYAESTCPFIDWGNYFPPGWTDPIKLSNEAGFTNLVCMNC